MKTLRPKLAHTPRQGWQHDSIRGSRHARGYGTEWEQLREEILARDNGICQPAKRQGDIHGGNHVDHIVHKARAKALGWTQEQIDHPSNLQTICVDCHRAKTSREARGGGGSDLREA